MTNLQAPPDKFFADVAFFGLDLTTGMTIEANADVLWPVASIAKVGWILSLFRQCAQRSDGSLSIDDRLRLEPSRRTPGPTGISQMADTVELSLRDAAYSAIAHSDNAAADGVWDHIGPPAIRSDCALLGIAEMSRRPMRDIYARLEQDLLSDRSGSDVFDLVGHLQDDHVQQLAVLDPSWGNAATPRQLVTFLGELWESRQNQASAATLDLLGRAAHPSPTRSVLSSDDITVRTKTGSLLTLRSEACLVTYPDGSTYALALFTRTASLHHSGERDAHVGRLAVKCLRDLRGSP